MCNRVIFPFAINSPVLFAPTCDEIIKKFHNLGTRASSNKLDLYVPLYADVAHSPFMNLETAAPAKLAFSWMMKQIFREGVLVIRQICDRN